MIHSLSFLRISYPKWTSSLPLAAICLVLSAGAAQSAIIDLGFALDESGSVGSNNYNLVKQGLANALDLIPLTGINQYRVSVVSFDSSASTIVSPTILDASTLAGVKAAIINDPYSGGNTNIGSGVALLTSLVSGVGFGDSSLINITTDGFSSGDPVAVRNTAVTAGWDSISAEAIGNFNQSYLNAVVYPQPAFSTNNPNNLPNPLERGFIVQLAGFDEYQGAIAAKVQRIVTPPNPNPQDVPESSSLVGIISMCALSFGLKRRKTDS